MLTDQDRTWLAVNYPGLTVTEQDIAGEVEFTAAYDEPTHRFVILQGPQSDASTGHRLTGRFTIRVQERTERQISALPALYVEGIDPIADRHFNRSDTSACLCSPLEEQEFLTPRFAFQTYFEQLVIPFLYGQVFYSTERRWPWSEYAHGAVGLLESYSNIGDPTKAGDCLARLPQDTIFWPRIRRALKSTSQVKGSTPCFCQKADLIRRCHPTAWRGVRQLKQDLAAQGLTIP